MVPRPLLSLLLIFSLLIPALATAQVSAIPDLSECTIETRTTQDVSVLICPEGDGRALGQAQLYGGAPTDATIEVYIRDVNGFGIPNFPQQDIWLRNIELRFCPGGSYADAHTDMYGYTEFALPLRGGGCSENPSLEGILCGDSFWQNPLPHIKVNSPDMNHDGVVNLSDLGLFSSTYHSGSGYCADFHWDGELNLVDVSLFARHYGHGCP